MLGINLAVSQRLMRVLQLLILLDADKHEPITTVLGQDDGSRQRTVAVSAEVPDKFNGCYPFHCEAPRAGALLTRI